MLKILPATVISITLLISCGLPKSETSDTVNDSEDSTDIHPGFNEGDYESYSRLENYLTEQADDAQEIDETCAIMIDPTEQQITEMEKEYGEDLATIVDDANFYQSQAKMSLDSLHINVRSAEKNILKLKGKDQTWVLDIRKKGAPEWNVIFFQNNKKPQILSAIDVSRETINQYFNP